MKIFKRSKRFYILGAMMAVGTAVTFILWFGGQGMLQQVSPPQWRGVTPSVTTMDEVRRILGEPHIKPICRFTTEEPLERSIQFLQCFPWSPTFGYVTEHGNASDSMRSLHQISFFIGGTVKKIVEVKSSEPEAVRLNITDILNRYGQPERSVWSVRDRSYNALLYCEKGIIVHISKTAGVGWIVYFPPMTTARCLTEFEEEIFMVDPDPDADFFIDEDPWGFNREPS